MCESLQNIVCHTVCVYSDINRSCVGRCRILCAIPCVHSDINRLCAGRCIILLATPCVYSDINRSCVGRCRKLFATPWTFWFKASALAALAASGLRRPPQLPKMSDAVADFFKVLSETGNTFEPLLGEWEPWQVGPASQSTSGSGTQPEAPLGEWEPGQVEQPSQPPAPKTPPTPPWWRDSVAAPPPSKKACIHPFPVAKRPPPPPPPLAESSSATGPPPSASSSSATGPPPSASSSSAAGPPSEQPPPEAYEQGWLDSEDNPTRKYGLWVWEQSEGSNWSESILAYEADMKWQARGPPGPDAGGPSTWRGQNFRPNTQKWGNRGGAPFSKKNMRGQDS